MYGVFTLPSLAALLLSVASFSFAGITNLEDRAPQANEPRKTPPTCKVVDFAKAKINNAKEIADSLNGIAEGITARAFGSNQVIVCGDDTKGAVTTLAAKAADFGKLNPDTPPVLAARESHIVRLYHAREATTMAALLQKAFPKLPIGTLGNDTLSLGSPDGSDAAAVQQAKRFITALDVPRPEVTLNVWSVDISSKNPGTVARLATDVRQTVAQHNRALQEALGRAHLYLTERIRLDPHFRAPNFTSYLKNRYVIPGDASVTIDRKLMNACGEGQYCLGYDDLFEVEPTLSSMLVTVLASRQRTTAGNFVDNLEGNDPPRNFIAATKSYASQKREEKLSLQEIYGLQNPTNGGTSHTCEEVADKVYSPGSDKKRSVQHNPVFPCLREALSDATEPIALARIRVAIADFLFHQKFQQQYPDDFVPESGSSQWMDSIAAPLLGSFNRDMASFLRHIRRELGGTDKRHTEFASNGIVSLSTISSKQSSVSTTTQSEFKTPPNFSLKDFLAAAAPPQPGKDQTAAEAAASKIPALLASNLVPGVSIPLAAGLALETPPAVASIGRNLNLTITSNSLPGASAAELTIGLESQDEAAPTIQRGSSSKPDTHSRVAKHNLQTVVRVDSIRLFELSAFSAELRRGGESIPLIPPYIELPVIGSLARWPVAAGRVYHRSFAIVSAVVLPTAADLASSVRPMSDVVITALKPNIEGSGPKGNARVAKYVVVVHRQDTGTATAETTVTSGWPNDEDPVKLSWDKVDIDARYDLYREIAGQSELLKSDLKKNQFSDTGKTGIVKNAPLGSSPKVLMNLTPASFLSGAVSLFHEAKLKCIYQEAIDENQLKDCDKTKLSAFPSQKQ